MSQLYARIWFGPLDWTLEEVLETRPLLLENLNPVCHKLVIAMGYLEKLVQVKIVFLGTPVWISIRKKDLVDLKENKNG